jgi:Cu+-exporting ATPase
MNQDINQVEEKKEENQMASIVIGVDGMMCKHCVAHVEKACKDVAGVSDAKASLEDKNVTVTCDATVTEDALKKAITDAGYDPR